jgi:sugar phosphate isomerase/epimerase
MRRQPVKWTLNTYEVAQKWDLDRLIDVCQKTGYPYIEFLMDFEQPHGLEWDTPQERFAEVKQALDAAGLRFGSFTSCQTFHSLDAEERSESVKRVKRVIDMAREFGCDHVRVLGDRLPEEEAARPAVVENVAACLRQLGEHAGDGISVSIEMHGHFTDPHYSVEVARLAALPNVGLVFNGQWPVGKDWKWTLPAGAESIKPFYDMVRPHLTSIHFHAMERPGELAHWQEWFRLLRADGYDGYVANESAYTGPDPEKVLRLYTALFETMIAD